MLHRLVLAALVALPLAVASAQTDTCDAAWMPFEGYEHAPSGPIYAFLARDDMASLAGQLVAAGSFTKLIGGAPARGLARWDGASWSELGGGVGGTGAAVLALTLFDDGRGGGPALYAGGFFSSAGGVPCANIAKWDGASWTDVGGGLTAGAFSTSVSALTVFDDGSGPALYAGGRFGLAGGVPCANIARWDGASWAPLGGGADSSVFALAVFDDGLGGGRALYASGAFSTMGVVACGRIAKWDGASWSPLAQGLGVGPPGCCDDQVWSLAVHDDGQGGGPALYAGGDFSAFSGAPSSCVARWDGSSWGPVGTGLGGGGVFGLAEFNDGSDEGPLLFAAGSIGSGGGGDGNLISRWDGVAWSDLDGSLFKWKDEWAQALAVYDDGSGSGRALLVGGFGAGSPGGISKWIRCSPPMEPWTDLGSGLPGPFKEPRLEGIGTLQPGSIGWLVLKDVQLDAPGFADVFLFVSLSSTPMAFKGGALLAFPPLVILPAFTVGVGGSGKTGYVWKDWPPGLPSGTTLYFQYVCEDIYAPDGVALSNAILATTP